MPRRDLILLAQTPASSPLDSQSIMRFLMLLSPLLAILSASTVLAIPPDARPVPTATYFSGASSRPLSVQKLAILARVAMDNGISSAQRHQKYPDVFPPTGGIYQTYREVLDAVDHNGVPIVSTERKNALSQELTPPRPENTDIPSAEDLVQLAEFVMDPENHGKIRTARYPFAFGIRGYLRSKYRGIFTAKDSNGVRIVSEERAKQLTEPRFRSKFTFDTDTPLASPGTGSTPLTSQDVGNTPAGDNLQTESSKRQREGSPVKLFGVNLAAEQVRIVKSRTGG